jgi:DNA invertase Pin-like site-specific DNA recombinase
MIALYLRCSTTKQDNSSQAEAIKRHLDGRGLLTPELDALLSRAETERYIAGERAGGVAVYSDMMSGKAEKLLRRKGWQAFYRTVPLGMHDELIVFSADRVVRSLREQLNIIAHLSVFKVTFTRLMVKSTGDELVDTLMEVIEGWRAENESKLISARARAGIAAARARNDGRHPNEGVVKRASQSGWRKFDDEQEARIWRDYMADKAELTEVAAKWDTNHFYICRIVKRQNARLGLKGRSPDVRASLQRRKQVDYYWNLLMGAGESQ